jgi:hypothetical protein
MRHFIIAMGFLSSLFSARAQPEIYTDPAFTFTHPKGWSKLPASTPDCLVFRDSTGAMQLTVLVMRYNSAAARGRQDFDRILQHRMNAEKKVLAASDSLEGLPVETFSDGYQARFRGFEAKTSRSFKGLLLMARGYILNFYLEGPDKTEEELKKTADVVFADIKLR